jgi:hypothetical protein
VKDAAAMQGMPFVIDLAYREESPVDQQSLNPDVLRRTMVRIAPFNLVDPWSIG